MAEDNPFLRFFESVGVGMEAGRERRSLMERSREGKLEPGETVPSLGATILSGITRAATPANTRLAQDQLKLQAANYALDRKIQQDRYQAQAAAETAKRSADANEVELEKNDAVLLSTSMDSVNKAFLRGGFEEVMKLPTPKFGSTGATTQYLNAIKDLDKSEFSTKFNERQEYRQAAEAEGIDPNLPFTVLKAQVDGRMGKYTQTPSQIAVMIRDLNSFVDNGEEENASIVRNYIQKLSMPSGQRIEIGKDGRVIFTTGTGDLTTSSKTSRQEAIFKAKTLIGRLEDVESSIDPSTVGAGGYLRGLVNTIGGAVSGVLGKEFTAFDPNVAMTKTNLDNLQSDLMGYIRSDSGNMSERDVEMLQKGIPKFSFTESAQQTKTKLAEIKRILLAKEFFARDELGEVVSLLSERGVDGFADSMYAARRLGFSPSRIKSTFETTVGRYLGGQSDLNQNDQDEFVKDAVLSFRRKNVLTEGEAIELFYTFGLIDQPKG